jgi:hypothetical protein
MLRDTNETDTQNFDKLEVFKVGSMDMKLGLSDWGKTISWECSRIGCWGWYLGLRVTRQQRSVEDYITRSFILYISHHILFAWTNREEWDGRNMCKRRCAYRGFGGETWAEDHLKDLGVVWRKILKWVLKSGMELMDSIYEYLGQDRNR